MELANRTQFSIVLANRRGELAKLAQVMAEAQVNIEALSIAEGSIDGNLKLVATDPDAARRALARASLPFSEQAIYAVPAPNQPGALARLCAMLAEQGYSINSVYGSTCSCPPEAGCSCKPMLMLSVSDLRTADALKLAALWPGP